MKTARCFKIAILFVAMIAMACIGCTPQKTQNAGYRVVTQIDVHYYKNPLVAEGSFTAPDKIQKILYYLRKISPYGTPRDDPEQVQGSDFYITLIYSDQTKKTYHQRDNRFMRINNGPWKRVDPKRAQMLSQILGTMNSDDKDTAIPFLLPEK